MCGSGTMRPMRGLSWPPSAAAGAERIIVVVGCAVRLGTLAQMLPSARIAHAVSPHPGLEAASWWLAAAATVAFVVRAATRSGPLRRWEVLLDCVLATALLVVGHWTVPVDERIGTWIGFQPGYALSVVVATSACAAYRVWIGGLLAVVAGKVVYVWSAVGADGVSTVVGDFLTIVVIGAIAAATTRYLRMLAAEADLARRFAAEEEQRRARLVLHNGIAMMGLLTEPGLDGATRSVIQSQARAEIHRVRRYLRGEPLPSATGLKESARLADVLATAAGPFADLAPCLMLDLIDTTELDGGDAEALAAAVTSLLLNVRNHAKATTTVIHADEQDGRWTVTVHDDGVGFDPAQVEPGVGLGQVVVAELEARGMEVGIDSTPGLGTTVTLAGAAR